MRCGEGVVEYRVRNMPSTGNMVCKRVLHKILAINCINDIYKSAKKVPHNAKNSVSEN